MINKIFWSNNLQKVATIEMFDEVCYNYNTL